MMHCQLFFFNYAIFACALYCCCVQRPLLLCSAGHVRIKIVAANSTAAPPCNSLSMECANLGNITFPFWGSAACAASPAYALSNCSTPFNSTHQAYWESFSSAATGVNIGPPAVIAIEPSGYLDYISSSLIQLSWNKSLIELGYCAPLFSSKNLSHYNIPSSINLTRFNSDPSATLAFSDRTTVFLFNCTQYANASNTDVQRVLRSDQGVFEAESITGCQRYKGLCTSQANTPCIEWSVPETQKVLMLQQVLDTLACSHFMLGTNSPSGYYMLETNFPAGTNWSTGSIELLWTDYRCDQCYRALGECFFDTISGFDCRCSNGSSLDLSAQTTCSNGSSLDLSAHTICSYCNRGCDGRSSLRCSASLRVKVGSAGTGIMIVVLGMLLAARFKSHLHTLWGRIRESSRAAFVSFTKVTTPIAINVVKSALRKLQSISYGLQASLDILDFDGLTERPVEYSYGILASATKSFTSLLGEGGFSSVYKGTLTQASSHGGSGLQIAVKVLEVKSKHYSKKPFLNEVITIGRVHHVNVVRLLGFCMQADHEILVYEYVANGSLDRWLFDVEAANEDRKVLDWGKRYGIALGVAKGLSYLHEECRHRTVHCDIKPQNILLDDDMNPKIADFGLARLMGRDESKVMTFARGTPGYMAPEFWMGGESQLSTKYDVYSYGMVLLELISGRRNFNRCDATSLSSSSSFPAMAFKAAMEGDLRSILDPRLSMSTVDGDEEALAQWNQAKTAAFVALWCIQDHPVSRPCMSEVVKYLEGGAAISESPPQPNISTFYGRPPAITGTPNPLGHSYEDDCTPLSVGR